MTVDPTPSRYHYDAIVKRVIDGDSIVIDIDLGLSIWRRGEAVRLFGINEPEVVGAQKPAGIAARDFLKALLAGPTLIGSDDPRVVVETIKDGGDKYGRLLAKVFMRRGDGWISVNDEMIVAGHAKPWDGHGARP